MSTTINPHAPLTPWSQAEMMAVLRSQMLTSAQHRPDFSPLLDIVPFVRVPSEARAADIVERYWHSGEPVHAIAARHFTTEYQVRRLANQAVG